MSSYIHYEIFLFLISVGLGAGLMLCYVFLRVLRRVFPHHGAAVAAEDLIYWCAAGFAAFAVVYRSNQGILRNFLFAGIFLGAWICRITVGPVFEKIGTTILGIPVFFAKKFINRLLFGVKRGKISVYQFVKRKKRGKKPLVPRSRKSSRKGRKLEKIKHKPNKNKKAQ